MKQHQAELRTLGLAMIGIEPSAARRLAFKSFGVVVAQFRGYPLKLPASREEGIEIARQRLTERAGIA
jgi:hypothetical protein